MINLIFQCIAFTFNVCWVGVALNIIMVWGRERPKPSLLHSVSDYPVVTVFTSSGARVSSHIKSCSRLVFFIPSCLSLSMYVVYTKSVCVPG